MIAYSSAAARRISTTLFVTQSLASAGLIANATINPIIGARLSGQDVLAGLPGTLLLLGAAGAAYPAARLMQRLGRRPGLALGFLSGTAGMLVGGLAVVLQVFPLFLLGLLLIGASRGAIDQSRYAAADAQLPEHRARAISTIVFASTVGAVGGPALVAPLAGIVAALGLDPLSGSMFGGSLLFGLAGALIMFFLRPDPLAIGRALAANQPQAPGAASPSAVVPSATLRATLRRPATQLAVVAMVVGQAAMVLVMTVTSLHMHHHQHGLSELSLVIGAHTLGMFGLSVVTGRLADRIGRRATIAAGAAVLILGCAVAPATLLTEWLALGLFLVGLGWNLCYIAGSSLLSESVAVDERGRAQGAADLAVNLTSACGSLASGFVLASFSYGALCAVGAALCLLPLLLAARPATRERAVVEPSS
jgi:MFS family permease